MYHNFTKMLASIIPKLAYHRMYARPTIQYFDEVIKSLCCRKNLMASETKSRLFLFFSLWHHFHFQIFHVKWMDKKKEHGRSTFQVTFKLQQFHESHATNSLAMFVSITPVILSFLQDARNYLTHCGRGNPRLCWGFCPFYFESSCQNSTKGCYRWCVELK